MSQIHDDPLAPTDEFVRRHIGPDDVQKAEMLALLGYDTLDALTDRAVPGGIHMDRPLALPAPRGESDVVSAMKRMAAKNRVLRSYIGMGYHGTLTPAVIQRNILENPGWYTQYTPYQAEISQGRLEALFNFQTMICDLTGLPVANSSLLDEATAAAEALALAYAAARGKKGTFFVARDCHPQTIAVVQTRAEALGIMVEVGDVREATFGADVCGVLVQYPTSDGRVVDYQEIADRTHAAGATFVVAADLLALTILRAPGEFGADICVGTSQRFGVPMGYGGPHAAFLATIDKHKRSMPGRIIGLSVDAHGTPALRLALQTREQHIRREKATSNICTAQVLLAVMAGMYAVYHGPDGLQRIAVRVRAATSMLAKGLRAMGRGIPADAFFDTLTVDCGAGGADAVMRKALGLGINLRRVDDRHVGVSFDETVNESDLVDVLAAFAPEGTPAPSVASLRGAVEGVPAAHARTTEFLTHPVFHRYHSETEMLRYMHRLQGRDLSLVQSMISLGSCTMKLNATSEMVPVTWPEIGSIHPFVPLDQAAGYQEMIQHLERQLAEITGFHSVSLQPNAGAQGEYTGLLVIRAYHRDRGDAHRDVCLIPASAHGTNPASAVMAGMKVVVVRCDDQGDTDLEDLRAKAAQHSDKLAALMVTYPSTHGVFEEPIREICDIIHKHGGQVYMDGANMNAQVGICRPGDFGADVCHLNLHKTFCIPHGGGGPGMGPIGVVEHLAPYLPGHPVVPCGGAKAIGPVSAAPWGSPSILPISYVYILMMGEAGLKEATQVAILNANYMAKRLDSHYPVLYRGEGDLNAHEFILDFRGFEKSAHVTVEDVAKRLMDYGFHAPTMSFPVAGTLMIEPTESESKPELDRFCEAMISIRGEIRDIEEGRMDAADNPLKNAPHTAAAVTADDWSHPYSREAAAFPAPWVREGKFWPPVARIDNVFGDRNLICSCPPVGDYE